MARALENVRLLVSIAVIKSPKVPKWKSPVRPSGSPSGRMVWSTRLPKGEPPMLAVGDRLMVRDLCCKCLSSSEIALWTGPDRQYAAWRRGADPSATRRPSLFTHSLWARFSHELTAPAVTPRASAMALCFQPSRSGSHMRKRRASRPPAVLHRRCLVVPTVSRQVTKPSKHRAYHEVVNDRSSTSSSRALTNSSYTSSPL